MSKHTVFVPQMPDIGAVTITAENGFITEVTWDAKAKQHHKSDDPLLRRAAKQLEEYFVGSRTEFDLPLKPKGTDFQKNVWKTMQKIPGGSTLTYGEVSEKLASGPRAVGTACGKNPIPILIPCHRIVGQTSLGGFSAPGKNPLAIKQWLLDWEAENSARPRQRRAG